VSAPLLWIIALGLTEADPATLADLDQRATGAPPPTYRVGAQIAFDSGVLAGVSLARGDAGIWWPGGQFALELDLPLFTGFDGARARLERHETVARRGPWTAQAVLGTGATTGDERAGQFVAWSGLVGARLSWQSPTTELGVRLVYLLTLAAHVWLSDDARDHFSDRYPDQRDTGGPSAVTLYASGQRAQALLFGRWALAARWSATAVIGLQPGLFAGRDRFNLEAGQFPFLVRLGMERSF
jgi:hypothetical protein